MEFERIGPRKGTGIFKSWSNRGWRSFSVLHQLARLNRGITIGLRRTLTAAPLTQNVRPTADGRANGSAGEPRWLRPPAAVEPADGTDGPAGHGSPADPLGLNTRIC
jgi:hypothetical protein